VQFKRLQAAAQRLAIRKRLQTKTRGKPRISYSAVIKDKNTKCAIAKGGARGAAKKNDESDVHLLQR
jgi:hypothetical protein